MFCFTDLVEGGRFLQASSRDILCGVKLFKASDAPTVRINLVARFPILDEWSGKETAMEGVKNQNNELIDQPAKTKIEPKSFIPSSYLEKIKAPTKHCESNKNIPKASSETISTVPLEPSRSFMTIARSSWKNIVNCPNLLVKFSPFSVNGR